MIRAMTSSCARDHGLAVRLSGQLSRHGVDHHVFVEKSDVPTFARSFDKEHLHVKPGGGLNGFGVQGSIVRWHCHQQMLPIVEDGDTFVNIDSDVFFVNEAMIDDLACEPSQVKGFFGDTYYCRDRSSFRSMSGMVMAVDGATFRAAMGISRARLHEVFYLIESSDIEQILSVPSEDVMAAYLYQDAGATPVNLTEKYRRFLPVPRLPEHYERKDFDVIA